MKNILVTGATAGIGLESAKQLAAEGNRLILVGRNPVKLAAATDAVRRAGADAGAGPVDTLTCDLADLSDVRRLADQVRATVDHLDVLVNNAGTVFDKRSVTPAGHESTFATNHLGCFLLTELLLDLMVASAPSRIVFTASGGHYGGTMDFDDLGFEHGYSIMKAYARSKLANVLYTRHLADQLAGTGVTVNCLHPGTVATDIWSGAPWFARPVLAVVKRVAMISPAQGGAHITYLATSPEVEGVTGGYFDNDREQAPSKIARDAAVGQRLVDVSRELVGLA